jgi:hypothetical protein
VRGFCVFGDPLAIAGFSWGNEAGMKRSKFMDLSIILIITFLTISMSFAGELSCLATYERMTEDMESTASASQAGDVCRAADMADSALYWAIKCEKECTYSKERMTKVKKTKSDLIKVLARFVKLCGH